MGSGSSPEYLVQSIFGQRYSVDDWSVRSVTVMQGMDSVKTIQRSGLEYVVPIRIFRTRSGDDEPKPASFPPTTVFRI